MRFWRFSKAFKLSTRWSDSFCYKYMEIRRNSDLLFLNRCFLSQNMRKRMSDDSVERSCQCITSGTFILSCGPRWGLRLYTASLFPFKHINNYLILLNSKFSCQHQPRSKVGLGKWCWLHNITIRGYFCVLIIRECPWAHQFQFTVSAAMISNTLNMAIILKCIIPFHHSNLNLQ